MISDNAFRGITPWRIFQYIASGLLGAHSFQMGWSSVGLGVVIHCIGLPIALLVKRATKQTLATD